MKEVTITLNTKEINWIRKSLMTEWDKRMTSLEKHKSSNSGDVPKLEETVDYLDALCDKFESLWLNNK